MGLAEDLLEQGRHLAGYQDGNPNQASLRRAVSTAYYALFHLLIDEAGNRWQGSMEARTGVERAFLHGNMRNVSAQFEKPAWRDWHGREHQIPSALRTVAARFVKLQDQRHAADYNNNRRWSVEEVEQLLDDSSEAFRSWQSIRAEPIAGNYLLAMLLGKQRS